jgi:hypothetical protein
VVLAAAGSTIGYLAWTLPGKAEGSDLGMLSWNISTNADGLLSFNLRCSY